MNTNLATVHLAKADFSSLAENQSVDFNHVTISNGYGLLTQAGVSVQRGVTAHIDVDMVLHILTTQQITNFLNTQKSVFTNDQWSQLQKDYSYSGAFGWLFGGSNHYYENSANKQITTQNNEQSGFLQNLYQQQKSKVHVSGTIDAVGQSYIPVEGFVYVRITTITFSDGTSLSAIDQNDTMVADANGSTNGIQQSDNTGKLNVVPIG